MWADIAAAAAAADADRWRPGAYEERLVDMVAQQQKQHRFGWNKWAKPNEVQRVSSFPLCSLLFTPTVYNYSGTRCFYGVRAVMRFSNNMK